MPFTQSQQHHSHLLKRLVGRPPNYVRRFYHGFEYQAALLDEAHRVIAKAQRRPGDLFPRVGLAATSLPVESDWIIRFYNPRGTAEQHIKEGKYAINWTRLSCKRFRDNQVRLPLLALAYNRGSFLQRADLPEELADWSLISIQSRLIKIGARVVPHARKIMFQLEEGAVSGRIFRHIPVAILALEPPPRPA